MSKGNYRYPEDEFDAAADRDGPRGVHRLPRSTWRKVWPFLAVLVVVPAIAYGLVTWAADSGGKLLSDFGQGQSTDAVTPAPTGAASSSTTPAPSGAATTPAPPAVTSAPPTEPAPNLAMPVSVINAARITGLAATEAKKLTTGGFTRVAAVNGSGTGVTMTTVYYATAADKATADAVAKLLGITTVTMSATHAPSGIAVVLTSDYPH